MRTKFFDVPEEVVNERIADRIDQILTYMNGKGITEISINKEDTPQEILDILGVKLLEPEEYVQMYGTEGNPYITQIADMHGTGPII